LAARERQRSNADGLRDGWLAQLGFGEFVRYAHGSRIQFMDISKPLFTSKEASAKIAQIAEIIGE
jgi:hypothetical protein